MVDATHTGTAASGSQQHPSLLDQLDDDRVWNPWAELDQQHDSLQHTLGDQQHDSQQDFGGQQQNSQQHSSGQQHHSQQDSGGQQHDNEQELAPVLPTEQAPVHNFPTLPGDRAEEQAAMQRQCGIQRRHLQFHECCFEYMALHLPDVYYDLHARNRRWRWVTTSFFEECWRFGDVVRGWVWLSNGHSQGEAQTPLGPDIGYGEYWPVCIGLRPREDGCFPCYCPAQCGMMSQAWWVHGSRLFASHDPYMFHGVPRPAPLQPPRLRSQEVKRFRGSEVQRFRG